MRWTKALSLLLCVSVLAAPAPVSNGLIAAADPMADYAAREAQAGDLEPFTGGWHGFVLGLVLIGVLVWVFYELVICEQHQIHDTPPHPEQPKP